MPSMRPDLSRKQLAVLEITLVTSVITTLGTLLRAKIFSVMWNTCVPRAFKDTAGSTQFPAKITFWQAYVLLTLIGIAVPPRERRTNKTSKR